jgi:acyl-CoA dehydrogenase
MRRNIFEEVHDHFRPTARALFERECVPNVEKCEKDGKVSPRRVAGRSEHGLIGWEFDEKYRMGGGRHRARRHRLRLRRE